MSLLLPDAGLLFWMLVAFGIVFLVLYKYGFPVILSMIEKRSRFIDDALRNAHEANEKLAGIERQGEEIVMAAQEEQARILREASAAREQVMKEARKRAEDEAERIIAEARRKISHERDEMLSGMRNDVAELSLAIAEKIVGKELSADGAQQEYIDKLLNEELDKVKEEK